MAPGIASGFELEKGSKHGFQSPEVNAFGLSFREYVLESQRSLGVRHFYETNHINQTYDFAVNMRKKHLELDKTVMSIWECCELLNEFVDESDPDLDEPQIEHLLQTAEAIRKDYPEEDWFHLTGLIHDLGKVLLHPKFGAEPQWAVVGDTYPLGCPLNTAIVHHEFFERNPDSLDPRFNTGNGIYEDGCGLGSLVMSWGHDEYLYQVLKRNNCTLPPQALFVIRYHSFYGMISVRFRGRFFLDVLLLPRPALHRANEYQQFLNDFDRQMLPWLKRFNKYDLYSKSKVRVDVEAVKPYYQSLIAKYFPDKLKW